ncbi:single-stranded DNA-binding protein [Crocinitomicaceae bacterium]|nr:single-stranded DNA-binding protein [Crocinitomicaceae bacterium]
MSSVFETRLIGNIGKNAIIRNLDKGSVAINFPVAHNKNWRDKKTGESKTNTTWINCTIWKREGDNMGIVDYLKKGALVELSGTTVARSFIAEDGSTHAEIRLNVNHTNILRSAQTDQSPNENGDSFLDDFESDLFDETEEK